MPIKLKPIKDQVIVITGASSGIGLATALEAGRRGARVVLASRDETDIQKAVEQITSAGGQALAVAADVADQGAMESLAEQAVVAFDRIDTWVNNAGVAIYGRLDEVSEQDSRRLFDTNFWGVVNGSLVALPYLKQNGGALINVGSEVSDAVAPLLGMYSASKHAVKGFTDALRVESEHVDKAPISITLIQPTAVNTPFDQHGRNYMDREPDLPTPMIDPQKVADAILSAAENPTRDVKVGMMSKVNTFAAKNMPSIADRMTAKQVKNLQRDEPAHDREGTLYIPGEGGHIHGNHPSA